MDLGWVLHADNQAKQVAVQETINLAGLQLPWRPVLAIVLTTLLITVDFYYDILNSILLHPTVELVLRYRAIDRIGLYLLIPLLTIVLIYRENPSDYGFTLGDWRTGLVLTALCWLIATPILYFASQTPAMRSYYAAFKQSPAGVISMAALDLFGWEFVFRGFLLFALLRVAGPSAVVLQAVPFALGHLGKPPLETLSTIFGGTLFGWVAWRTRSFLYPFLMHLYILSFTIFAVTLIR
jgi:membrane protease YdiL (CAAX protease family)